MSSMDISEPPLSHPGERCVPCAVTPPLEPPPRMLRSRVRISWGLSVSEDDIGTRGRYGLSQHSELGGEC